MPDYPPHGITAEILAEYGPIDPATPNIGNAIDAAVAHMRRTARWHVFPAVDQVLTLDGEGGHVLTLPTLRVNSVQQVTEQGTALSEWDDYEWSRTGDFKRLGRCWTTRWQGVTVELNHGYAADDGDLADLLKALATAVGMAAANPLGIPEVIGPFQFTGAGGGGDWIGDAGTTLERFVLPWSA